VEVLGVTSGSGDHPRIVYGWYAGRTRETAGIFLSKIGVELFPAYLSSEMTNQLSLTNCTLRNFNPTQHRTPISERAKNRCPVARDYKRIAEKRSVL
jgi:hypothetical protein